MSIDDIVKVKTSATGSSPTQENFGTPMVFTYHKKFTDLWREYPDETAMVNDGWLVTDPGFMTARAVFAQNPRPDKIKIGTRKLAWTQVIELTPAEPSAGMVYALDVNGIGVSYTATAGDDLAAVVTALALAINTAAAAGDADAFATGQSSASPQTISGASLNGIVGGKTMSPPRSAQLVLSNHADWDATTAVITGIKENGQVGTENLAIPNGGNTTLNGTTLWRQTTSLFIPAQTGTGGTFMFGTRSRLSASGSSGTKVAVTATDAAQLQTFGNLTNTLSLFDATADPGIATDIADVFAADTDWYGVLLDSNSDAEITAAATWTESNKRLFLGHTSDTACTETDSTTDIMYKMKAASMFRCVLMYHPKVGQYYPAAAWAGERFPDTPGTDTWGHKELAGVEVYSLSATQLAAILSKNGNAYLRTRGLARTYASKSGGARTSGGEWIDKVRGIDAVNSDIQTSSFNVLANATHKIPFTDVGVAVLTGAVADSLGRFTSTEAEARLFSGDPAPTVTAPKVKDVSAINRDIRNMPGIKWKATVSGAIHAMEIDGEVTT